MGFFKSVHRGNQTGKKRHANFRRDSKSSDINKRTKKAKFDGQKRNLEKKIAPEDEEIPSSSEAESIGNEEDHSEKSYEDEENAYEEDSQTLAYREAKKLLESLKSDRDGAEQEEDEEADEEHEAVGDSVAARLRQEAMAKQAKLHQAVAARVRFAAQAQQRMVAHRGHRLAPVCVCFSSNGDVLVSCSKDGAVVKYDLTKRCRTGNGGGTTANKLLPALCCEISPDDQYLVTGSVDGLVRVWRLDTLAPVTTLSGHRGRVTALRFRRQCTALELFSASTDKSIKVWSLDEMGIVNTLYGHQDAVQHLDILQWPRLISCGGMDKSCRLFKVLEDSHLVFNGFSECVSIDCVAMINEEHFVSGSVDGSLYVWTMARKKPSCVRRNAHNATVAPPTTAPATPSANGTDTASSIDNNCPSTNVPPPASSSTSSSALPPTSYSSNASSTTPCRWICAVATLPYTDLVASGSADGWLRLWCVGQNYKSIEPVDSFYLPGFINDIRFSPDGKWLACAVGQEHKAGRWWTQRAGVRNRVVVIPLEHHEQQPMSESGGDEQNGHPANGDGGQLDDLRLKKRQQKRNVRGVGSGGRNDSTGHSRTMRKRRLPMGGRRSKEF